MATWVVGAAAGAEALAGTAALLEEPAALGGLAAGVEAVVWPVSGPPVASMAPLSLLPAVWSAGEAAGWAAGCAAG